MDEFQSLVTSLGIYCKQYFNGIDWHSMVVSVNPDTNVAEVELALLDNSAEEQDRAYEAFLKVMEVFDEVELFLYLRNVEDLDTSAHLAGTRRTAAFSVA